MYIKYLLAGILTLVLTLLFTPVSMFVAKKIGAIDYPGERRVHLKPIPRLGGVAMYLSFFIVVLLFQHPLTREIKGLLIGATIILFLGIYDDVKGVSPKLKLAGQILAALVLVFSGYNMQILNIPGYPGINLGPWGMGYFLVVFWVVSLVNTVNITDGLDGLAAGICFVACLVLLWSAIHIVQGQGTEPLMLAALAGTCLGFLFFNFHPAKVFMGDSGSMFLGFALAAISVSGALKTPVLLSLVLPLLALGLPIFDITFAVIRRKWKGQPIALADRGHLHHRLLDRGFTHRQAVLFLYVLSALLGGAALFASVNDWRSATSITMLVLVVVFALLTSKRPGHATRRGGGK